MTTLPNPARRMIDRAYSACCEPPDPPLTPAEFLAEQETLRANLTDALRRGATALLALGAVVAVSLVLGRLPGLWRVLGGVGAAVGWAWWLGRAG